MEQGKAAVFSSENGERMADERSGVLTGEQGSIAEETADVDKAAVFSSENGERMVDERSGVLIGEQGSIAEETADGDKAAVFSSEEGEGMAYEKFGLDLPDGLTALDMLIKTSEELQCILRHHIPYLLQCVFGHEEHLLKHGDYRELKQMAHHNPHGSQAVQNLLQIIMSNGEAACCEFLCLLQGANVIKRFPLLRNMPWYSLTGNENVSAKDMIRKNGMELANTLMPDIKYAIQCLFEVEERPLVFAEYRELMGMSNYNAALGLLRLLKGKGERICQVFLSLLQDKKLTEIFPDLRKMPWVGTKMPRTVTHGDGFRFKSGMSCTEMLRINNLKLQNILASDIGHFIGSTYQEDLIDWADYIELVDMSPHTAAIELLDTIIWKGEKTCDAFISMLQTNELAARRPELMTLAYLHTLQKLTMRAQVAQEIIRKNKLALQDILMSDIENLLELLCERELITRWQRYSLSNLNLDPATALVDKIIGMGESTCNAFLDMLKGEDVIEMFPALKTTPWFVDQTKNAGERTHVITTKSQWKLKQRQKDKPGFSKEENAGERTHVITSKSQGKLKQRQKDKAGFSKEENARNRKYVPTTKSLKNTKQRQKARAVPLSKVEKHPLLTALLLSREEVEIHSGERSGLQPEEHEHIAIEPGEEDKVVLLSTRKDGKDHINMFGLRPEERNGIEEVVSLSGQKAVLQAMCPDPFPTLKEDQKVLLLSLQPEKEHNRIAMGPVEEKNAVQLSIEEEQQDLALGDNQKALLLDIAAKGKHKDPVMK